MMIDIEVNKEAMNEEMKKKKEKEKEVLAGNPVTAINLTAPPEYATLEGSFKRSLPQMATRITVPPLAKADKAEGSVPGSAANSAQPSPVGSNRTRYSNLLPIFEQRSQFQRRHK
ncbi:hypothetical protein TELCIR_07733 [Teladorsagia circumcincta]|uniref:Uncharacterized protein n=1 Tax=Teladorsagia circumcincta TaxID=45464 RepID=A0A2G9ULP7_TELCI|nr:hypothetical protein TELCIR_07733 [Teladorsagia circumcincta]